MEESPANAPLIMQCPECGKPLDVTGVAPYAKIECPHCATLIRVRTTMGQYQIIGLLGEGGMSQVFRALDRNLGREVALKILHQSLSRDDALTAMFEREAKLTASIVHPNVVKVFTVGQDHGYFFIAMELLQAISLEQLITNKGALSEAEVLGIAQDVAQGLKAAHEEQLIHRDIKPGNMLVTSDGTTKLVDFGLALQQGSEDFSEDLWATPFYVPPEKLEGVPDNFLGDIYSLGATLYHALAGKPPFDANTSSMEELKAIKKNPVDLKSAAPGLSRNTVKLVERMMAYRPADRIQSYGELIAQIEELRRRHFGVETSVRPRSKKRRIGAILLGGAGLLGAVTTAVVLFINGQDPIVEGDLGIANGDRVITAGDHSITGQYLGARDLFTQGRLREAEDSFASLAGNGAVPASTRIWSCFLLGSIRLVNGEQELSREAFQQVLAIAPEADSANAEAIAFLKRAAASLAEPLPLLAGEASYSPDSVEALGLFAAGLKNWQHGEFESGAEWLKAFAASRPSEPFGWIEKLKPGVEPFLGDFGVISSLPNPSASASGSDLSTQTETLKKGGEALRTRGAAPRLVKRRLDRIGEIRKLAAAVAAPQPPATVTPSVPTTTDPPVSTAPPTAEEQAEIERIKALAVSLRSYSDSLLFSGALIKLQSESVRTPLASAIRDELVHGYGQAERFLPLFVEGLAKTPYEGIVKRRAGRDLEATVTAKDSEVFIVDLGFGPNEVDAVEFSPGWLVDAGSRVLPPLSVETARSWESLVFFALVTGQGTLVEAKAGELSATDPEFARRWSLLKRLE